MNRSNRHNLFAGLGLIVLINAIVLAGVAWNRSEPADSRLLLSERELGNSSAYWREDDSGLALRLNYRWPNSRPNDYSYNSLRQLTPAQMQAVGQGHQQALMSLDGIVQTQAVMLGTNQVFGVVAIILACVSAGVWLMPKPKLAPMKMGGGH